MNFLKANIFLLIFTVLFISCDNSNNIGNLKEVSLKGDDVTSSFEELADENSNNYLKKDKSAVKIYNLNKKHPDYENIKANVESTIKKIAVDKSKSRPVRIEDNYIIENTNTGNESLISIANSDNGLNKFLYTEVNNNEVSSSSFLYTASANFTEAELRANPDIVNTAGALGTKMDK